MPGDAGECSEERRGSVKETLRELDRLSNIRVEELNEQGRCGLPVIGYSGTYIPEEIIRAAGAETYLLCHGGESVSSNPVLSGQLRFMNPLSRTMAGYPQSDPQAPSLSLLVLQQTDCHTARAGEFLAFEGQPVFMTGIPSDWNNPASLIVYEESLCRMINRVEEITGCKVDWDKAKENFAKTNRINALFRRIDFFRKMDDPPFSFCDWVRLQHASFMVDDDVMIEKLEGLVGKLQNRLSASRDSESAQNLKNDRNMINDLNPGDDRNRKSAGPRILLAGRAVAPGDYRVPAAIEESGALIAAQMLDEGIRIYEKDVDTEGDLILSFVKNRYLKTVPANFMQSSWERRLSHMMKRFEEYRIDGVVWYQLSFDEIYDMEYSFLAERLAKRDIPLMKLESSYDYSRASMGMLMTRVESFVESTIANKDSRCKIRE